MVKILAGILVILLFVFLYWLEYMRTFKFESTEKAGKGIIFKEYILLKEYKTVGGGSFSLSCLGGEYIEVSRSDRHESTMVCK